VSIFTGYRILHRLFSFKILYFSILQCNSFVFWTAFFKMSAQHFFSFFDGVLEADLRALCFEAGALLFEPKGPQSFFVLVMVRQGINFCPDGLDGNLPIYASHYSRDERLVLPHPAIG
jgi:hypothetical protein